MLQETINKHSDAVITVETKCPIDADITLHERTQSNFKIVNITDSNVNRLIIGFNDNKSVTGR